MAAGNFPAPDVGATRYARRRVDTNGSARRWADRLAWLAGRTDGRPLRPRDGALPTLPNLGHGPDLRTAINGLADHRYTRLVEIPIQRGPKGLRTRAPNA